MRFRRWLPVLGLALASAGCDEPVKSVNPIYTEMDVVFEPRLLGTWAENNNKDGGLVLLKKGEDAYRVLTAEGGAFDGRLVRLGAHLYLDVVWVGDRDDDLSIPAHLIFRIELKGDTLRMAMLEAGRLKGLAELGIVNPEHLARNSDVLTATTRELQELIALHGDDGSAFADFEEFRRVYPAR